jgi:hypothetical protein
MMANPNEAMIHEDALEKAFAVHNEKLREIIEQHKTWLESELRKAHFQLATLTRERDLLVKEALKLRKIISEMNALLRGQ